MVKMYTTYQIDDYQWVIKCVQHLYQVHITTQSPQRREYFHQFSLSIEMLFKAIFILYAMSTFQFILFPLFVYVTRNELVLPLPMYIWRINEETTSGYIILTIMHIFLMVLCFVGLLAFDYILSVVIISSLMFAKLICWEMTEIDIDLQESATKWRISGRLRNILEMHRELFE